MAVDFRTRNPQAAKNAMAPVYKYYVRSAPNEERLRAFYLKAQGSPKHKNGQSLEEDRDYWRKVVWAHVWRYNEFGDREGELRKNYRTYWVGVFGGRFPDWDDHQLDLADLRLQLDGDRANWSASLDRQFLWIIVPRTTPETPSAPPRLQPLAIASGLNILSIAAMCFFSILHRTRALRSLARVQRQNGTAHF